MYIIEMEVRGPKCWYDQEEPMMGVPKVTLIQRHVTLQRDWESSFFTAYEALVMGSHYEFVRSIPLQNFIERVTGTGEDFLVMIR